MLTQVTIITQAALYIMTVKGGIVVYLLACINFRLSFLALQFPVCVSSPLRPRRPAAGLVNAHITHYVCQ